MEEIELDVAKLEKMSFDEFNREYDKLFENYNLTDDQKDQLMDIRFKLIDDLEEDKLRIEYAHSRLSEFGVSYEEFKENYKH